MKRFSTRNLKYMRKFAELDVEFVQQVAAQLPWYHNVALLEKIENCEIRLFYIREAIELTQPTSVILWLDHRIQSKKNLDSSITRWNGSLAIKAELSKIPDKDK